MDDWSLEPPTQGSAAAQQLVEPDRPGLERLAPWLQLVALLGALGIMIAAPPIAAIGAWALAALVVPALWAWYIYEDKQRQLDLGRGESRNLGMRVNQIMLWLSLVTALASGWLFATEVAK